MANIEFDFTIEMERGKLSVEYLVKCEVSPPEKETGPTYDCAGTPAYPASVESKEVYFVGTVRCPDLSITSDIHFGPFPKMVDGQPVTPSGKKCFKCKGTGLVPTEFRREELDDMVDDEEVLSHIPEPDEPPDED